MRRSRIVQRARGVARYARFAARAAAVFAQPAAREGITARRVLAALRMIATNRQRLGPHTTVELHAIFQPERTAVVDATRRLDWRGFDREIAALAVGLRGLGVRSGERVAIALPNVIEHAVALQALQRIGATAVQIGYRLTSPEIAYIFRDAEPTAVLYHPQCSDAVLDARDRAGCPAPSRLILVGDASGARTSYREVVRAGAKGRLVDRTRGASSGLMIYTSGTTGRPKGARRSLRASGYAPVIDFMHRLGMAPTDRHLVVCPLYHIGAFGMFSMMTSLGAASYLVEHFDPEAVLALVERERLTSAFMVPTMLARILAVGPATLARFDTSSLRWVASSAAPLPPETARRFSERFGPILWNFYGATETGVVTLAGPDDLADHPGTIGRPLPGNRVRLLDDRGADVAIGEVGELHVRSAMLIGGYHGNRSATDAAMRDGYFSVGDLARRDTAGYLYLESRKTDMIISGGVNIYPREIEDRLGEHPGVADCAVFGVPDEEWGERVIACVVPRTPALDADALARHCRASLAGYKCPRQIELVAELPRNETGKVLKRVLRDRYR